MCAQTFHTGRRAEEDASCSWRWTASAKSRAQTWLYDMNLSLQPNAVTVLLGATQAGKTSLMRIMAGWMCPPTGACWWMART